MLPGSRFIHARRQEQYCAKSCAYKNGSPYEIWRPRLFARSSECCVIQSNLRQAMPFFVEAGFNLNLISRIGSVWLPIMRHSQSKGILPSEDNSWQALSDKWPTTGHWGSSPRHQGREAAGATASSWLA